MRNHDQKSRDMARSILPSTTRHISRKHKLRSARTARARNTARLTRLMTYVDDPDRFEEDLKRYDLERWGDMIETRRNADKVAPLVRWAGATIDHTPRLSNGDYWTRRNYFAAILGDTVSGRHALQHLDHLFGSANPWEYGQNPDRPSWDEMRERGRQEKRAEHARRLIMLDAVIVGAGPGRLNARIRAVTPPVEQHWRWILDAGLRRVPASPTGYEPWLFDGDTDRWLRPARGPLRREEFTEAQIIAFEALAEVHAEMFGHPPVGR